MSEIGELLRDELRGAAFRRLVQDGAPVPVQRLAADLGRGPEEVADRLRGHAAQGQIHLDDEGRVTGSAGLSVVPDRHRIELDGRTFWTWCAYDVMGIFGALEASGTAHSSSPSTGARFQIEFRQGRPVPSEVVLFLPEGGAVDCCSNVYEQWCPNSNFFESHEVASAWASEHGQSGRVLTLGEAGEEGTVDWKPLAHGLP
jgi:hypothetical protein